MRNSPHDDREAEILEQVSRLKRERRYSARRKWLQLSAGIAAVAIFLGLLYGPELASVFFTAQHRNHAISQQRHGSTSGETVTRKNELWEWSDAPLLLDSLGVIAIMCPALGMGAFLFVVLVERFRSGGYRLVATAMVLACAWSILFACLLFLVCRSGDTPASLAGAEDFFVVFGIPMSLAVGLGATVGAGVAETI